MTSPKQFTSIWSRRKDSESDKDEDEDAGSGSDSDNDEKKPSARDFRKGDNKTHVVEPSDPDLHVSCSENTAVSGAKQQSSESSRIIPSSSRTPRDILCGRGMPFQSYPGNIAMHEVVNQHKDEYIASRRSDKPRVIKNIILQLKDSGARFLKPYGEFQSNESDRWVEVDDQYVYDKISHVMRHRQRAARGALAAAASRQPDVKETPSSSTSFAVPAVALLQESSTSSSISTGLESLRNAFNYGNIGSNGLDSTGLGQLHNSILAQIQDRTFARPNTGPGVADQQSMLQALIQSERASLLSELGLTSQPMSLLRGQNHPFGNQQLLSSALGLQQQRQHQVQQQALIEQALVAHLQQQQLQREIQNQRLFTAAAGLQSATSGQQPQNSTMLEALMAEELRRQLLIWLAQNQGLQPPSESKDK
ncbi:hypothetical protein IV203_022248 [Nitzschia inconspicua]|uniref:DUF6824 domain-containing protein n=1 Tax=Nitzschia inconspicua TaxID=303405 RepID=A0A9K3KIB6_9STRA|nr:hypothetical protein IV203_022248 [Nitzschia inconspicua]